MEWNIKRENHHAFVSEQDAVLTVVFNRPDKLNAITPEMTDLLWESASEMIAREDLRVMVITGLGRYFCAGIDMALGPRGRTYDPMPPKPAPQWRSAYRRHHLLYDEFEAIEKPVILAAQGTCLGAGAEMACSCDVRISASDAEWGLPEINMGVIPGSGGVSRLTRLVGPHWAKWLTMCGQRVDSSLAQTMGLVHAVYPREGFHRQVQGFAASLGALPPYAMGVAKSAIDIATDLPRDSGRTLERHLNSWLPYDGEGSNYRSRFERDDAT